MSGENIRKAIRWLSAERQNRPDESLVKLVDEAAFRFDLSPSEQETLLRTFASGSPPPAE